MNRTPSVFAGFMSVLALSLGSLQILSAAPPSVSVKLAEQGISFPLPTNWFPVRPEILKKMNNAMGNREKALGLQYLAVVNRGEPYEGKARLLNALMIGFAPGRMTPEEIVTQFDLVRKGAQLVKEENKENIQKIDLDSPYLDEGLGLLVIPHKAATAKAGETNGRTYVVPTSNGVVTVIASCQQSVKLDFFLEVESGLKRMRVEKEFRLQEDWLLRLKDLMRPKP